MRILVLSGSPRPRGVTAGMAKVFCEEAEKSGHDVRVFDICKMSIHGCVACEYCHGKGEGRCAQRDDMDQIYAVLADAEMLVIAAPIYYHGISGQLKCVIDRFYAMLYPKAPATLRKVAMFLASDDPDMYDGAKFSYDGDFLGYLGLEGCGIFTNHDEGVEEKIREMARSL